MLFLVDRVLGGGDTPGKFVRVSKERSYGKKCLYVCENKGAIGIDSCLQRNLVQGDRRAPCRRLYGPGTFAPTPGVKIESGIAVWASKADEGVREGQR